MSKTYWDQLNKDYHFEVRRDTDYLADLISRSGNSLLEHSVGTGSLINILRKKGWEGLYVGTDYAENFLKWAKENNPDEHFVEQNLFNKHSYKCDSFDCVAVHHGLEYVYPYRLALEEMKRIARKYVFITFWVPFTDGENQIRFNEEKKWNVNFYNKDEWFKTLEEIGLDIECEVEFKEYDRYNKLFILSPCK
jgi:ubiquinone/menaquinone biosynthesis C-methylase UbiE